MTSWITEKKKTSFGGKLQTAERQMYFCHSQRQLNPGLETWICSQRFVLGKLHFRVKKKIIIVQYYDKP